ncbi:protein kinase domain-containing protein [Lentzea flaviverrucosa]|uniref:Serine/threonine protein kinase n=1 Tax=Lentzea flaviverrucosa TaxID=200379 RepID=A0A1H9CCF3_9PSEU|nr:protein kinase [Lentzea flaviverrucosa]RDI24509.1 serine/threonine protein kinase [Lentzea flaviverrucosa]SEP98824.1 Serine/threonine protein kinase [Lentzea flaviverrucosa]
MTTPEQEAPTVRDPGRDGPVGAVGLLAEAVTVLDAGRPRPGNEPPTVIDPGRAPMPAGHMLPAELLERFEVVRELTGNGSQGEVFLTRERSSGADRVLKVHHGPPGLDGHVAAYLTRNRSLHVVEVHEAGVASGQPYEVMQHVPGGTVRAWRDSSPSGVDPAVLTELVGQVSAGLKSLHDNQIVHRDLKPANVLVRSAEPLEVAIADFGISVHVPHDAIYRPEERDTVGTIPYTPPEYLAGGAIEAGFDWWSLGITLRELATGELLWAGVHPDIVRSQLVGRQIDVDGVRDERIALLCRGLLTTDLRFRWGAEQVDAWLRGESPAVAAIPAPTSSSQTAATPYVFLGAEYHARDLLALSMSRHWNVARELLFGDDARPRRRALTTWLKQFPDHGGLVREPRGLRSADTRLLYLLRRMDPGQPAVYRERDITRAELAVLAQEAFDEVEGQATGIITDLWQADLLPLFATARGGDGLAEIRTQWHAEEGRLRDLARGLRPDDVRAEFQRLSRQRESFGLVLSLLAACATDATRSELQLRLGREDRALQLPWFEDLVRRRDYWWIALALAPYANREADRLEAEERQRRAHDAWLRRTAWQRETLRRLNRPMALGYAAVAVVVLAVALYALVTFSEVVGFASEAQILDAYLASVVALTVVLVTESLLAWDAGERYHPAYSFFGGGRVVLGRIARRLLTRRIAVPAVLVALAGLAALTAFQPVFVPFLVVALMVVWTVQRYLAWRERDREELAIIAAG